MKIVNFKLFIFFIFIVYLLTVDMSASVLKIQKALEKSGIRNPIVFISEKSVKVHYLQKVSEISTLQDEAIKISEISKTIINNEKKKESIIIRQIFDDDQIIEITVKVKDIDGFLLGHINAEIFLSKLEINPLTRGLRIVPDKCMHNRGDDCLNSQACSCYPNEKCKPDDTKADIRGCLVVHIPVHSELIGSEYICKENYSWNKRLTDCIPNAQRGISGFGNNQIQKKGKSKHILQPHASSPKSDYGTINPNGEVTITSLHTSPKGVNRIAYTSILVKDENNKVYMQDPYKTDNHPKSGNRPIPGNHFGVYPTSKTGYTVRDLIDAGKNGALREVSTKYSRILSDSKATVFADKLRVDLHLRLKDMPAGKKYIYAITVDLDGEDSGWKRIGEFNVAPGSQPNPGESPPKKQIVASISDAYAYAYNYRNWNRSNRGKYDQLVAGWHPTGGESRAYIKFDLSNAGSGNIDKATLKLYHIQTSGNDGVRLGIFRVTSPWNEGSDTYHSGRNEKTALPGDISWVQQPEIDRTSMAAFNPGNGMHDWVEVNITSLVKKWLSGTPNYGLVIKSTGRLGRSVSASTYHFASRERNPELDEPKGTNKAPELILSKNSNANNKITQPPQKIHDSGTLGRNSFTGVNSLPFFENFDNGASKWILPTGVTLRNGYIVWNTGNFNSVKLKSPIPMKNIVIEFDGYAETNGINVWLQNNEKKGYTCIFGGWYNAKSGSDIGSNEENRQLVAGKVWISKKWQHYKIVISANMLAGYCEGRLIFQRISPINFDGYGHLRFDSWNAVIGIDNIHIYRTKSVEPSEVKARSRDKTTKTNIMATSKKSKKEIKNKQKLFQKYTQAYERLQKLMGQGKGNTLEAQAAYKEYKKYRDLYNEVKH